MTNIEKVRSAFESCPIGTVISRGEAIQRVILKNPGTKPESIIPSDYCYNITNWDKRRNRTLGSFNIFVYTSDKTYIYVGENHPYNGSLLHNAINEVVGKWVNGSLELYK